MAARIPIVVVTAAEDSSFARGRDRRRRGSRQAVRPRAALRGRGRTRSERHDAPHLRHGHRRQLRLPRARRHDRARSLDVSATLRQQLPVRSPARSRARRRARGRGRRAPAAAGIQQYVRNTNVLQTTVQTRDGAFRVTDCAPRFIQNGRVSSSAHARAQARATREHAADSDHLPSARRLRRDPAARRRAEQPRALRARRRRRPAEHERPGELRRRRAAVRAQRDHVPHSHVGRTARGDARGNRGATHPAHDRVLAGLGAGLRDRPLLPARRDPVGARRSSCTSSRTPARSSRPATTSLPEAPRTRPHLGLSLLLAARRALHPDGVQPDRPVRGDAAVREVHREHRGVGAEQAATRRSCASTAPSSFPSGSSRCAATTASVRSASATPRTSRSRTTSTGRSSTRCCSSTSTSASRASRARRAPAHLDAARHHRADVSTSPMPRCGSSAASSVATATRRSATGSARSPRRRSRASSTIDDMRRDATRLVVRAERLVEACYDPERGAYMQEPGSKEVRCEHAASSSR